MEKIPFGLNADRVTQKLTLGEESIIETARKVLRGEIKLDQRIVEQVDVIRQRRRSAGFGNEPIDSELDDIIAKIPEAQIRTSLKRAAQFASNNDVAARDVWIDDARHTAKRYIGSDAISAEAAEAIFAEFGSGL